MADSATVRPSFGEALRFWLKLGCISFGGPAGQIALMHAELVEKRRWISDERFLHALNFCMLLPGPEAQQLATSIGWSLHRTAGGLAAGVLFVLPSALLLWVLSSVYVTFGHVPWIAAAFYGLKPVIVALIASALFRLGKKALKNAAMWALAAAAFCALFFLHAPFPAVILAAATIGWIGSKAWPQKVAAMETHTPEPVTPTKVTRAPSPCHSERAEGVEEPPKWRRGMGGRAPLPFPACATYEEPPPRAPHPLLRAARVLALGLALWWAPIIALAAWLGWDHTLTREGLFFSKAAVITFGGAYAVLPYVAQQAVENFGWLSAPQMLDGLGLAESTPGPLIIVLQFVGFLGGWNAPGSLPPLLAATLGAAITTWATFVPCFLWIFLGAPHLDRLRANTRLSAALSALTAAVVGGILSLAVWFALHAFFPGGGRVDWFVIIVAAASLLALVWRKADVLAVIATGAGAGVLWSALRPLLPEL